MQGILWLVFLAALFLFGPFLTCFIWNWTIPVLFPGAISSGFLAVSHGLNWVFGFKIGLLAWMLSGRYIKVYK